MFGISGGEFLVILLVIMVVIGPSRLPEYTRAFAQFVRKARVSLEGAKASVREELGPELSDLKLADFDPRNYDPRKIVRDVMGEDLEAIKRDLSNPLEALKETVTDTVSVADDVATSGRDALQSQPGQAPWLSPPILLSPLTLMTPPGLTLILTRLLRPLLLGTRPAVTLVPSPLPPRQPALRLILPQPSLTSPRPATAASLMILPT